MINRGAIRNKEYARQLNDFTGLRYDKITPTDIDGFMDFGDRLFVLMEGKHKGAELHFGQRLALERLTDACHNPPHRISICLIVDHANSPEQDVDFASCVVREVRWCGKWMPVGKVSTVREAIDGLKVKSENKQWRRSLAQGGAA